MKKKLGVRDFLALCMFAAVLSCVGAIHVALGAQGSFGTAKDLMKKGNFAEAYAAYTNVVFGAEKTSDGDRAQAVLDAARCLSKVNRVNEVEPLLAKVRRERGEFPVRLACVQALGELPGLGDMTKGVFTRHSRGYGSYSSVERDRVTRLRWLEELMPNLAKQTELRQRWFWNEVEDSLSRNERTGKCAWKLQELTDLSTTPEITRRERQWWMGDFEQGRAPVDAAGEPVFHALPSSWAEAKTDGERWRYANAARAEVDGAGRSESDLCMVLFAQQQFGVQTLQGAGNISGLVSELKSLAEDESIARLANGVRRFKLPKNYLRLLRETGSWYSLGQEFERRYQFDKALEAYSKGGDDQICVDAMHRIKDPAATFEGEIRAVSHARRAKFQIRFRNVEEVEFSVRKFDTAGRLDKVVAAAKKNKETDARWNPHDHIASMKSKDGGMFAGPARTWSVPLESPAGHFDARREVEVPFDLEPGEYLLKMKARGGNSVHAVLNVEKYSVVRRSRPSGEGHDLHVVDAETGAPAEGVKMRICMWGALRERKLPTLRKFKFVEKEFVSDKNGLVRVPKIPEENDFSYYDGFMQFTDAGGTTFVINGRMYHRFGHYEEEYGRSTRGVFVTDRPAYRPGDTMKFKVWAVDGDYSQKGESPWAGRKMDVRVYAPQSGDKLAEFPVTLDSFGGGAGEFAIPKDAKLGRYSLQLGTSPSICSGSFRVEEYRKPEFEVAVDMPKDAPMLGDKITATVRAKYYFGEPVKKGTAKVTVKRTAKRVAWYPRCEWDWLYGAGSCWLFYDCDWYSGTGCLWICRPYSAGMPWYRPAPAPETIVETTAPLDEKGEVKVTWDTSLVRKLYGDDDQEYSLSVAVTDDSRRTIDGGGSVLVRAEPYRVFAWTDRPRYRVGDRIKARRSLDGLAEDGVKGEKWRLFRLEGGKESEVELGDADAAALSATKAGQYRISCEVTDGRGRTREGSRIFTVLGGGEDGRSFRYSGLELVPDKDYYRAGDTVRLAVNADHLDSFVFLRVRNEETRVLRIDGKTSEIEIPVTEKDMPNFFVEAWTVSEGRYHSERREIKVPPVSKVGRAEVEIAGGENGVFKPGEEVKATVRTFDENGSPCGISGAVTVYDKAVDAIAGGPNVRDLKSVFWSWRRNARNAFALENGHASWMMCLAGDKYVSPLGLFGERGIDMLGGEYASRTRSTGVRYLSTNRAEIRGMMGMVMNATAPAPAPAAAQKMSVDANVDAVEEKEPENASGGVRSDFADTAYWNGALEATGEKGVYRVAFKMPEDITGWNVKVWTIGAGGRVAEVATEIVTRKELMMRMQTPRFFTERDEVVLSANVHNLGASARRVKATLALSGAKTERVGDRGQAKTLDLPPGSEMRIDWRVKVLEAGRLKAVMRVADGRDADGVERELDVVPHAVEKTESYFKVVKGPASISRRTYEGEAGLRLYKAQGFPLPKGVAERDLHAVVEVTDTLAEGVAKALPYLRYYEYECTEQTMNRFVPAAVARRLLEARGMGKALGDVDALISKGLEKLAAYQNSDGGWGWFWGPYERSYAHMTATVVRGLAQAKLAGTKIPERMISRAGAWLAARQRERLAEIKSSENGRPWANDVLTAYAMLLSGAGGAKDEKTTDEMLRRAYDARLELPFYAQALLGLALELRGDEERCAMVVRNMKQFLQTDAENGTCWFNLRNSDCWWHWYGSDLEAQAVALKLLLKVEPKSDVTRGVALYLHNNRKNRTHWTNTRDTGLAVEALAEYCEKVEGLASDEGARIDGPVFITGYVTYLTPEEPIRAAGLELKVNRAFARVETVTQDSTGLGAGGASVAQRRTGERLVPLRDGDEVKSGDMLEVRLDIDSKNDYEYILVEDRKGAGFEPLELQSGYKWMDGASVYVEYREKKTAMFLREIPRGARSMRYRVRVETPGAVHVLPAAIHAMYAPRLRGNSDEIRLKVGD